MFLNICLKLNSFLTYSIKLDGWFTLNPLTYIMIKQSLNKFINFVDSILKLPPLFEVQKIALQYSVWLSLQVEKRHLNDTIKIFRSQNNTGSSKKFHMIAHSMRR